MDLYRDAARLMMLRRLILRLLIKAIIPVLLVILLVALVASVGVVIVHTAYSVAVRAGCALLPSWLEERWVGQEACGQEDEYAQLFKDLSQRVAQARESAMMSNLALMGSAAHLNPEQVEAYLRAASALWSGEAGKGLEESAEEVASAMARLAAEVEGSGDNARFVYPKMDDILFAWASEAMPDDPYYAYLKSRELLFTQLTYAAEASDPSVPCGPGDLDSQVRGVNPGGKRLGLVLPVSDRVTSSYGDRFHPIRRACRMHAGVDFAAGAGDPIKAAFDGTVVYAGLADKPGLRGYGPYVVVLRHASVPSLIAFYAHTSLPSVSAGDRVRAGDVVARVASESQLAEFGNISIATGPHLHFELRYVPDGGWGTPEDAFDPCALYRCDIDRASWWQDLLEMWRMWREVE